jgi:hypothetical protein
MAQMESYGTTDVRLKCYRTVLGRRVGPMLDRALSSVLNRSIAARNRSTLASSAAIIQAVLSSRLYPHGQALSRPQRRPGHPVGPIGDHLDLGEAVKHRGEDNLALHPG